MKERKHPMMGKNEHSMIVQIIIAFNHFDFFFYNFSNFFSAASNLSFRTSQRPERLSKPSLSTSFEFFSACIITNPLIILVEEENNANKNR